MNRAGLTTLGEVANRVDEMTKNCFDRTVPVQDIRFEHLGLISISGEAHPLREIAQKAFCFRLGIPYHYLLRCEKEVQAYNLNHWIRKERNKELLFRFDGTEVRAMFTTKYHPIDNFEVLERLYALGFHDETPVQCRLDEEFMSLSILEGERAFRIRDETFHPGVTFANSEVGLSSLSISAFVLRLVCTNGMIAKADLSKRFKHISGRVLEKFAEILDGVGSELAQVRDRFRVSMESPLEDPEATLESFSRQFQLTEPEREAVAWAWPQEQGPVMFNIVNTYTKAAQYEKLTAASSYKLQKTGGLILSMLK